MTSTKTTERIKKQLVREIKRVAKERKYLQKDLAERCDTTAQRISHLMADRYNYFRMEVLIAWLNRLGRRVKVVVSK